MRAAWLFLLLPSLSVVAQVNLIPADDFAWVNLSEVLPNICIELRYAGASNIVHRPIYAAQTPALLRAGVARKVSAAETILRRYNYNLKIWDAYRPSQAQAELWKLVRNDNYVADPAAGSGSLHSWGVAIDATIVDNWGRNVPMPTDFDDFTPAAMLRYTGSDPVVRAHLYLLQKAMAYADFYGLRTEWWHFTSSDWKRYLPPEVAKPKGNTALSP